MPETNPTQLRDRYDRTDAFAAGVRHVVVLSLIAVLMIVMYWMTTQPLLFTGSGTASALGAAGALAKTMLVIAALLWAAFMGLAALLMFTGRKEWRAGMRLAWQRIRPPAQHNKRPTR